MASSTAPDTIEYDVILVYTSTLETVEYFGGGTVQIVADTMRNEITRMLKDMKGSYPTLHIVLSTACTKYTKVYSDFSIKKNNIDVTLRNVKTHVFLFNKADKEKLSRVRIKGIWSGLKEPSTAADAVKPDAQTETDRVAEKIASLFLKPNY